MMAVLSARVPSVGVAWVVMATARPRLNRRRPAVVAKTNEEADEIRRGMQAVEDRIARDMDPVLAASQMDVDEIVRPSELRLWIASMVAMSYQATGYRRVKNPRIWSLHDLNVIRG